MRKKLCELITYSIFHTKNTKAQEEICFIVRREAEKVFSCPSEQATDQCSSTVSTSATHMPTPSLPTTQTQVTSSPHSSVTTSSLTHDHFTTTSTCVSSYRKPIMMGCTSNQDLIIPCFIHNDRKRQQSQEKVNFKLTYAHCVYPFGQRSLWLACKKIPLSLSSFYIGNPNICKHKNIKIKKMAHVITRPGKKNNNKK